MRVVVTIHKDGTNAVFGRLSKRIDDDTNILDVIDDIEDFIQEELYLMEEEL